LANCSAKHEIASILFDVMLSGKALGVLRNWLFVVVVSIVGCEFLMENCGGIHPKLRQEMFTMTFNSVNMHLQCPAYFLGYLV
jgi:hypothetical protein